MSRPRFGCIGSQPYSSVSTVRVLVVYRRPDGRARGEHCERFPFAALDLVLYAGPPHRLNDVEPPRGVTGRRPTS